MKLGDYEQALKTFDAAITIQPYVDTALYHRALLFTTLGFRNHDTGDLNTALQDVNKALNFSGGTENAKATDLKVLLMQILAWNGGAIK